MNDGDVSHRVSRRWVETTVIGRGHRDLTVVSCERFRRTGNGVKCKSAVLTKAVHPTKHRTGDYTQVNTGDFYIQVQDWASCMFTLE